MTTISVLLSRAPQAIAFSSSVSSGSARSIWLQASVGRRGAGGVDDAVDLACTRAAQSARKVDRQQVDQPVERALGVGGQLLDGLEVEEEVAAGGVPADPERPRRRRGRCRPRRSSRASRPARSRGARRRRPCPSWRFSTISIASMSPPASPMARREPSQGTGDVGQLHAQQVGHRTLQSASTLAGPGCGEVSVSSVSPRVGQPQPQAGGALRAGADRGADGGLRPDHAHVALRARVTAV